MVMIRRFDRSLTRLLTAAGYAARVFSSAQEFLDCSDCDGASCLICDLRMPRMNGLELQASLRARLPELSIIFLTGHGDVAATVAAMKAGAVDLLEKPVKRDLLLAAIKRAAAVTDSLRVKAREKKNSSSATLPSLRASARFSPWLPPDCSISRSERNSVPPKKPSNAIADG